MVMYSKGAYSWSDIYNFPLWLKRFTYNNLLESAEQSQIDRNSEKVDEQASIEVPDYIMNLKSKSSKN